MIYLLIFTHWFADFVLQTDDMATKKSKSLFWLSQHILAYGLGLWGFCFLNAFFSKEVPPFSSAFEFVIVNMIAHFAIDFVTSKITSKLWQEKKVHNFFVVIGFDQALHMATIFLTYEYFLVAA